MAALKEEIDYNVILGDNNALVFTTDGIKVLALDDYEKFKELRKNELTASTEVRLERQKRQGLIPVTPKEININNLTLDQQLKTKDGNSNNNNLIVDPIVGPNVSQQNIVPENIVSEKSGTAITDIGTEQSLDDVPIELSNNLGMFV